ncbi:MAG: hypothetical protein PVJ33_00200 [Lysobacterales bacterium]|jgi:hypothetical protein
MGIRLSSKSLVVLLFCWVVILAAPLALAAGPPPCKGPNKNDPGCPNGSPGPEVTSSLDIMGSHFWTNAKTYDPVTCTALSIGNRGGEYDCGDSGTFTVDTTSAAYNLGAYEVKGQYPDLCRVLDTELSIASYSYAWTDPCTDDGACDVEVRLGLVPPPDPSNTRIWDSLVLVLSGVIQGYTNLSDPDPFDSEQNVVLTEAQTWFYVDGKNKDLETCKYALGNENQWAPLMVSEP